jgi:hypothetical protein
MGRPRKFPPPRFFSVVAETADEADLRRRELDDLAEKKPGNAVRIDRLGGDGSC